MSVCLIAGGGSKEINKQSGHMDSAHTLILK